jgi:hypothetical protein
MSHLLRRYSFASVLRVGAAAAWIDALCSDFVFWRSTQFTWREIRHARQHDYDLTDTDELRRMRERMAREGGAS